jgi:UDP-N-acetylglucosamine 2-epimerase (non-hydrolysing)
MTDVAFIIGTRPEIIKTAPVIEECERRGLETFVLHTGQHYSESLDEVFFENLELDPPDVNLGVGSGDHGEQTGAMLAGVEAHLERTDPDAVVVQGDTNSTLAGGLAGAKLDVAVVHVEAGLRSFDREMPEETNRVVVDHLADHLFPPTDETAQLLRDEGLPEDRITGTGNTIVDAVTAYDDVAAETSDVLREMGLDAEEFALMTAHRAETVDDDDTFENVLTAVARAAEQFGHPVVYPVHPRARERIEEFGLAVPPTIRLVDPLDFFDFLRLESTAGLVFTDSGGVQEECCILGTPCVTLRYGTERPETAFVGANVVAGHRQVDIITSAVKMYGKEGDWPTPFGDGDAAARIVDELPVKPPQRVVE